MVPLLYLPGLKIGSRERDRCEPDFVQPMPQQTLAPMIQWAIGSEGFE